MAKWLMIVFVTMMLLPLAYALQNVTCQWSPDNTTKWRNVTHIEVNLSEALQAGLQSNTLQYFRCKNATTDFTYLSVRTKKVTDLFEGENMATLIFWFGMAAAIFTLIMAMWGEDQWVASLSAILWIIMGVWIMINGFGDLNNMVTTAIAVVFWGFGAYILLKANVENI